MERGKMEIQPLDRIDDQPSGETPEDVAILYSWANLQGAKYRDFSANRREYRAQMRHRAAEQLRLLELKAQSEAEAAASQADEEAAAAHAEADAATAKLAASKTMHTAAPAGGATAASAAAEIEEEETEHVRKASLREAAQQARKAAAERLEAARRAEAASLADSIARREEREIAEAQASAIRQAAQYAEAELRSRQTKKTAPIEDSVPGRISDPYSPTVTPEGEYFELPGTPVAELELSRFRMQREYIERNTGVELPPLQAEERRVEPRPRPAAYAPDEPSGAHSASVRRAEPVAESPQDFGPRRQAWDIPNQPPPMLREGRRRDDVVAQLPPQEMPKAVAQPGGVRTVIPSIPYNEFRRTYTAPPPSPPQVEVVSRIPDATEERARQFSHDPEPPPVPRQAPPIEYREEIHPEVSPVPVQTRQPDHIQVRPEFPEVERSREMRWVPELEAQPPVGPPAHRTEEYGFTQFEPAPQSRWETHAPEVRQEVRPEMRQEMRPEVRQEARSEYRQDGRLDGRSEVRHAVRDTGYWDEAPRPQAPAAESRVSWSVPAPPPPVPAGVSPVPQRGFEPSGPAWLYPKQAASTVHRAQGAYQSPVGGVETEDTLLHTRERVASRWFALKGVFARNDADRAAERKPSGQKNKKAPIVAVFSLAGGVGKTSLVATLGRALSSMGERVLLTDTTSHGVLPFYFGASHLVTGVVRTFSPPSGSMDAPIHLVSYDVDQDRGDVDSQTGLVDDLLGNSQGANRVLMDMNVNCAWMIGRLAWLKPTILIPLAADMNSVISLQAVEKSFNAILDAEGRPLQPFYLLNQFDAALPLHLDVREVLKQQLGDRLLPFVIRRSTGVSEALAEGMTIVDYDPDSGTAQDYLSVASWLRSASAPVTVGFRNLRWSER